MIAPSQQHQPAKSVGDSSNNQTQDMPDESLNTSNEGEANNIAKDLDALLHAFNSSIELVEVKSQKALTVYHLAIAEAKLSVHAMIKSAFVIALVAALVCFAWILANVFLVVFTTEHFNSIYMGLGLSFLIHLIAIAACFMRLKVLSQLIGFSRLKRVLE